MKRLLGGVGVLALLIVLGVVSARPAVVTRELRSVPVGQGVVLEAALHRRADQVAPAPALLLAHGFAGSMRGQTAAAEAWARQGYVVLTWSARGFGGSGGVIGLADPRREIADVSVLIDLLADTQGVLQDASGDPRVAIAGGSYGGGTALLAGAADQRLDVVVAVAAWHDLPAALAPNAATGRGVLKSQWASLLFTAGSLPAGLDPAALAEADLDLTDLDQTEIDPAELAEAFPGLVDIALTALEGSPEALLCGRFDPDICAAYLQAGAVGTLDAEAVDLLARANLAPRLADSTAPTLIIHHLGDTLFGLGESLDNAVGLQAAGVPTALRWIDGGHGGLAGPDTAAGALTATWLDRWLSDSPDSAETEPIFSWVDAVSGVVQDTDVLPPADTAAAPMTQTYSATPAGQLIPATADAGGEASSGPPLPEVRPLVRPAGALPASISVIPGLDGSGQLASFLPTLDIPGQGAAFTSDALDDDLILLGRPSLTLDLQGLPPAEPITVLAKLYDVSPGGGSTLINAAVTPIRTDALGPQEVTLGALAHRLVAGNRLRLSLATTDQAFAIDRTPQVSLLRLADATRLVVPVAALNIGDPLPAAVRIALPLLLVLLGVLGGWVMTRRREDALAGEVADADAPVVRITGLAKAYADGKVAVDGIDLTVARGQVFGLLGPNGAGKTTTMRMLLGLILPTAGSVELLGHPITPGHPVFHRVGVLVEGPGFAPYLSGRANLTSYWLAGGRPMAEANLDGALAIADLGPAIDRPTRTYSHGMRQRLAIAQALLGDPELLILDEPTDGLDPEQIRAMRQLLARLGEQGMTILVSSHLLAEVEQMCTHAAVMQTGKVVASGPVAELMGATRTVVFTTDDRPRAREVLEGLVGPDSVDAQGDGVVVTLGDTDTSTLVQALVDANIAVSAVTPRGRLEDTFMALTGADG